MSVPLARIRHAIAGRARLQVREHKGDTEYFERLVRTLSDAPSVRNVRANVLTGSALLQLDGELAPVLDYAQKAKLFTMEATEAASRAHRPILEALYEGFGEINERVSGVSDGQLNLASLATVGLAGLALTQVLRGRFLPAGGSLLWYAAGLVISHGKPREDGLVEKG